MTEPSDVAMKVWLDADYAYSLGLCTREESHQAAATIIARAIADAVAEERARIVEWLRSNPRGMLEYEEFYASAIERGDHKENPDVK